VRTLLASSSLRWNVLGLAVVVALAVALWPRTSGVPAAAPVPAGTGATAAAPPSGAAVPAADLVAPRAAAALRPCPVPAAGATAGTGPLAGLRLECLGDGSTVDLGAALAGKPAVLDLWAWYCQPCAAELPAMQTFAATAGDALTVLTVHSDPAAPYGLERLARYGVHLPTVQDTRSRVAALVGASQVLPATVLLRADGTVATILYKPYSDPAAIAADVSTYLGVTG
jgi:thiol-disulfide isomerase/thioredoxin